MKTLANTSSIQKNDHSTIATNGKLDVYKTNFYLVPSDRHGWINSISNVTLMFKTMTDQFFTCL
jgi:hypothetical protein